MKKKKKKKEQEQEGAFTLVELLAVIVILGLLMAIAIPSVTKYITQSRIRTLVTTMDSYVTAVITQVNNGEYKFSDSTKVFAIPIECVELEKGGTNPFGNWYQANSNYWAYVLVHYDSANYNYEYGFTFKDDAGYGLYPTLNSIIENSMVRTGYDDLNQPQDGPAKDFVPLNKWKGFSNITEGTELVVLEAKSEGEEGDGQNTCTLCQKGDNYDAVEEEKLTRPQLLTTLIKKNNTIIDAIPKLHTSFEFTGDVKGLYVSSLTNSGNKTYYYRGDVTNNFVKFAGLTWRIIRINEDGTIRLIYAELIGNSKYNSSLDSIDYMYYSKSDVVKSTVDNWYQTNIYDEGYDSFVAESMFCEAARAKYDDSYTSGSAIMTFYKNYNPDFRCVADGNGKGPLYLKVGLISYDETLYAGGFYGANNRGYYLTDHGEMWTMSPRGYDYSYASVWLITPDGWYLNGKVNLSYGVSPVINLKANVKAVGTGTISDPYVVQAN